MKEIRLGEHRGIGDFSDFDNQDEMNQLYNMFQTQQQDDMEHFFEVEQNVKTMSEARELLDAIKLSDTNSQPEVSSEDGFGFKMQKVDNGENNEKKC